MKEFPRIHSLGTINIIHHQEFFYRFHPFRTDFVGESGVGKSIVTDLLQLILVGSTEYSSSTQGKDDRPFNSLVLQNTDSSDFGYAFINVEVSNKQYVVLGTYIELNNNQSQAFIIQKDLDFDSDVLEPMDKYIAIDDFEENGNWIPINDLDTFFNVDKEIGFKKFNHFKSYHETLKANDLLPVDVTTKSALKDYAKILQAFSRKGLSIKDGVDLQEFLFGKNEQQKFYTQFEQVVSSMEESINSYRVNRQELDIIEVKKKALYELYELRKKDELLNANYNKLRYHKLKIQKDGYVTFLKEKVKSHFDSKLIIKELNQLREKKITSLENEIDIIIKKLSIKQSDVVNLKQRVDAIKSIDALMEMQNLKSIDDLREFHIKYNKNKRLFKSLQEGTISLKNRGLLNVFESLDVSKGFNNLILDLGKDIEDSNRRLQALNALVLFSDINNKNSLAYWIIKNNSKLSVEQESVIRYFQSNAVGLQIPDVVKLGSQYILDPKRILDITIESEENGFWVDFGGVNTFIEYCEDHFFDGKPVDEIVLELKKNKITLEKEIVEIKNAIDEKNSILAFIDELDNSELFYEAWKAKSVLDYKEVDEKNELLINNIEYLDLEIGKYKSKQKVIDEYEKAVTSRNQLTDDKGNSTALKKQLEGFKIIQLESSDSEIVALKNKHNITTSKKTASKLDESKFYESFVSKYNLAKSFINITSEINNVKEKLEKIEESIVKIELLSVVEIEEVLEKEYSEEALDNAEEEARLITIEYQSSFKKLIEDIPETDKALLKETQDFKILVRSVLPDIFSRVDFEENEVISLISEYLDKINRKNAEITKNKLINIRDLMQDLQGEILRQTNIVRRIDNIFKRPEAQITGGHIVSLKKTDNPRIASDWIGRFLEELTVVNEGLFDPTNAFISDVERRNQVSIEDHIIDEYKRHSDYRMQNVTLKELLSPFSYYSLNYEIRTAGGKKNSGSTGQTYAAIALLCIAKLSLMQDEQDASDSGLRFMSIDEAAGIGSNFDMLKAIAKKYGYQILSLSIDLNRINEGEQTIYRLFKVQDEDFINHHPVPVFSKEV